MQVPHEVPLEERVQRGESQTLEFKRSLSLRREGLEALCAMVNSDLARGMVVFGIEPDGTVCGVEQGDLDAAQRSLLQVVRDKCEPPMVVQIEVQELNDHRVLVLSARRYEETPYHEYDGRAWLREGTSNRRLSLSEKEQLIRRRRRGSHPGPWRCDRCGSLVGVLHSFKLTGDGMKKTYGCECGGEFWPVA